MKRAKKLRKASTGAGTGALPGGGLGWLVGMVPQRFRDSDGSSPLAPIVSALAGPESGGGRRLTGALIGMGIPEYEAKRYEGRVKDGGILLSVHSDSSDQTKRAKEILERHRRTRLFLDRRSYWRQEVYCSRCLRVVMSDNEVSNENKDCDIFDRSGSDGIHGICGNL